MNIKVCSVCWGEMRNLLDNYGLRSLHDDIKELNLPVKIYTSYREFFEDCKEGDIIFYTAPDVIWSRHSLTNLINLIKYNSGSAIALPHFRINQEDFLASVASTSLPMSAPELIKLSLNYAHQNFYDTFCEKQPNITHAGINSLQLRENLITVCHYLPTVIAFQFRNTDRLLFEKHNYATNQWDRDWLADLVKDDRLKIVGSSDVAFMVELTSKHSHYVSPKMNTSYAYEFGTRPHNDICKKTIYTIRY